MSKKQPHEKDGILFYHHDVARWLWLLTISLVAGIGLPFAPAWAVLTPSPVAVDAQVKVEFSKFEFNRHSNTYDGKAELTNRSTKPIRTPIRLVIKNIKPSTVSLANPSGLLADGSPYVNVPVKDGILSPREEVEHVLLKFKNPKRVKFTFNHNVLGVIPNANHPPVANAGADQSALVGSVVTLNGTGSTDEDGDTLTYQWRIIAQPAANAAVIDNKTAIKPNVTIKQKGSYQIELIVNDGKAKSEPDIITITTENTKPVAMAGDDQTVFVNQTAFLDGSLSTDLEGDPLAFQWQLSAKPANSLATLLNSDTQIPNLTPDKPGPYTVELIVNDGLIDSLPDQVIINTLNSIPVANAGPEQTDKSVGVPVILDGSLSSDTDGDGLTYDWSITSFPGATPPLLSSKTAVKPTFTPGLVGDYIAQLIVNDGTANSDPATSLVTVTFDAPVNNPPQINTSPILTATVGSPYSYDVDATDADNDALSYHLTVQPTGMTIDPQTGVINWTPGANQTGPQSVSVNVIEDGKGGSDSQSYTITVAPAGFITVPDLTNFSRTAAETAIVNAKLNVGTPSFINNPATSGNVISQVPGAGASVAQGTTVTLTISLGPDLGLPPDPANIAPKIDSTVASTISASTQFLYSGNNPIQTGVAPDTIEAKRASVIRGKVLDILNQPISSVAVTILNHPELGQTLSRADGQFDMAVNGGGTVTVNYAKAGLLPSQRQIDIPWQDYVLAPDVVLKAVDNEVATITTAATAMQVARGSTQTDKDGSRRATILFPAGTTATMTMADGSNVALPTFHVRATEYTVGDNGPEAMPGELPATSGYTYAVEYSVDEAQAAGATEVTFNQPVISYNENFLKFPVGTTVPSGYYDRNSGQWKAESSGRIVKIAAITNGAADLIIDNSNTAASENAMTSVGITLTERQQLATLYTAGQTLWRVSLNHFSPWDFNWARRLPPGARSPSEKKPSTKKRPNDSCELPGCILGVQGQTLSEEYPVVGTPYYLRYDSDRQSGYVASNTLTIPLISEQLPPIKRIDLTVRIAGQQHEFSFPAALSQSTDFTWDGQDAYGRGLQGQQIAFTDLGYVYDATVQETITFAETGTGVQLTGDNARNEVTLHQTQSEVLGNFNAGKIGLGGWTLNAHHHYDPISRVLYQGDGSKRSVQGVTNIITTAATTGFGDVGFSLDVGADGSLYYADRARIHKIDPQGNRSVLAGNGVNGYSGDGGPAVDAQISHCAQYVNVASDSSIIFFEGNCGLNRIRKIDPNGIITTIAGTGNSTHVPPPPEGIPGTQFSLIGAIPRPAPDGSVYIADVGRLWKLGTDGLVREVKIDYSADDAGPGNLKVADFAVGNDGSIYIMDTGLIASNYLLRKLTPDGKIHVIAGTNVPDSTRDGGPALTADILPSSNGGIAVSPSGDVYFSEGNVLRKIGTDGIISQFAGNRVQGYEGDGGPATQARVAHANALAFGPDGALYMAHGHIRRVGPPLPGYDANDLSIPSEDGSELFVFDADGKHLRTVNALTGATVLSFAYDSAGRLITVTDGDNNVTTIERDSLGNPTGIVGPYNQRTQLSVNGNGYFSSITNPANEIESFTYSSKGLLLSKADAANHPTTFAYDELGRLISDKDALNSLQTLTESGTIQDYTVQHQSPLGRKTDYQVQFANDGSLTNTVTAPDGTQTQAMEGANGINQTSDAEGTTSSETLTGDPRWNMQAPYAKSATLSSGGLTATVSNNIVASLSDPSNLLSLTALTQTSTINNRSYISQYLAANKTLTETSPLGRSAKTQIDTLGRPVLMQVTGLFDTQATYDSRGRLSTVSSGTGSDQRSTTIAYNSAGYVADITDALGRVEGYEYDAAGRVTRQTLTDGREIVYSYDSRGNLTALTPPGRPRHSFTYDALNQNDVYSPPAVSNGGSTQYAYNKDRQLSLITRPDNQTLALVYDTAGRLDTLKTPLGDYGYGYHQTTGQLTQLTSPTGGKLDISYNGALQTGVTFSGEVAGSVGYGYDNDFRLSEVSVNAANPVSYDYDNDSLVTQVGDLQFSRNSQNGLLTGSTLGVVTDSRSFDGFAETTQYQASINSDTAYKAEYSYDKLGRITQKIETLLDAASVTDVYSYDTAGRLSQVKKGSEQTSYGYDSNGNRTTVNGATVGSYDDQDRLTSYNGTSYAYTANGELLSKTKGGSTTNYQYDVLGNLRQVTFANGDKIDYSIDGLDRRVGRKATINGVSTEQRFIYQDGLKVIAELDGNNQIVSRFVYGSRINMPDYMIKDGNTYRLITDHLGSPRIVINTATGAIAQRMNYDAWGKVLSDSNPGFQPFGFAGGLYDRQTGLVRFGARDYEAETGRWMIKDPILFEGRDTNLYGYVLNDPVNLVDHFGTDWVDATMTGAAAGAVVGAIVGTYGGAVGIPVGAAVGAAVGAVSTAVALGYGTEFRSKFRKAIDPTRCKLPPNSPLRRPVDSEHLNPFRLPPAIQQMRNRRVA